MRIVGLISGGKDGIFNMLQCIAAGHEIVAIANIEPQAKKDEIDSYMYQTVGHEMLSLISGAIGLPIYRQKTRGLAICKDKNYVETREDEVEDLFALLSRVKDEMHVEGVSVGAIASDYQRTRVENVCMRLNLKCFAYLWKRDQEELLQEMIDAEIDAIIIKVACMGLKPNVHLGMSIKDMQPLLLDLNRKFGVNICGEGGEYETLTIDCPLYCRQINIHKRDLVIHSDDDLAPVGYLSIKNAELEAKIYGNQRAIPSIEARAAHIKGVTHSPLYYIQDCMDAISSRIFEVSRSKTKAAAAAAAASEVLPFPFASNRPADTDSRLSLAENWRASLSGYAPSPSSHIVTFSPAVMPNMDTTVFQLNHSTGWCCLGNVNSPGIKEGLNVVRKHLERYQYELRNIVSISLFVRDMSEWPKINKTYAQFLPNFCPPARSCVAVPLPGEVNIIITVVAHRLVSKAQKLVHHTHNTVDKDVVHVQSISHWAPANIGPYSQAVRIGEIVYVAGQIPLVPGTMELLIGPVLQQCRLTLRHIFRILRAVNENYSISNIMSGVCYVVSEEIASEVSGLWSYITKNEHATIAIVIVSGLPRNAQLEWHVLACGYPDPKVTFLTETVDEEFAIKCKRGLYVQQNTSVAVFHVGFAKKTPKKDKNQRQITSENVLSIVRFCLNYLRQDVVAGSANPLCTFTAFYRASDHVVAPVIGECFKTPHEFKVVITCIPVVALGEPDAFLTISGVCH